MTKEEAIHVINQVRDVITKDPSWMEEATRVVNEAADMAIKALETQEWILCSERLPEETGKYLITEEDGEVCVDTYLVKHNEWEWYECFPIAWMPLPEPFKEGEG